MSAGPAALQLPPGAATGIGTLPHADARAAAELVLRLCPLLPSVPSLPATPGTPRQHPSEVMLAQVVVGVRGVHIDGEGQLVVDADRVDPLAEIAPDLDHPTFRGLRAFCEVAQGREGIVKWQVHGPLSLGGSLLRRGVPVRTAYGVAVRAVRAHLRTIHAELASALPGCRQIVFLNEPSLSRVQESAFPLAADVALDIVSGALATVEPACPGGLHCCHPDADIASLLATGPRLLSLPVRPSVLEWAGYLARFLDNGGWVAWGAVPTDGPIAPTSDRYWRELSALWCELVRAGCDAGRLRRQALVTPACGLAMHDVESATAALTLTAEIAGKVAGQAMATKLSLGA
jgi:hypothetical protein